MLMAVLFTDVFITARMITTTPIIITLPPIDNIDDAGVVFDCTSVMSYTILHYLRVNNITINYIKIDQNKSVYRVA